MRNLSLDIKVEKHVIKNAPFRERRPRDAISRDVAFVVGNLGNTRFFVKINLQL